MPLNGYTDTKLRNQPITKGQVARIIAAFQGQDLSMTHAVNNLYKNNLATGATGKNDYQDYGAHLPMTRADAAVFFKRLSKYGDSNMIGLGQKASGTDDKTEKLPTSFIGKETVIFPKPEKEPTPPVATNPDESKLVDINIDKGEMIANGRDSTFLNVSLKTCSGNAISYEDVRSMKVTSSLGATITGDQSSAAWNSSTFSTDGPDLIVEVTAPASTRFRTDTISFQVNPQDRSNVDMDCYTKPITVQLDYAPQAELRIDVVEARAVIEDKDEINPSNDYQQPTKYITATIVHPGGKVVENFNGRVRFHSAEGVNLSNEYAYFQNGVARTSSPIWNTDPVVDEISAEIDIVDPRYQDEIASILNKTHVKEVFHDAPLWRDYSCSADMEVGFIIDSSGSMRKNDKDQFRVTKTVEFLDALGSSNSLASRFNSRGIRSVL